MPRVSVIIPCYNLGAYLDEAVDSVLAQTFTDFEILVVNDGSTEPFTCQLLEDYRRPKTRVIHTDNRGVAAARNRGIQEAEGEYILPLDADDRIASTFLEKAVEIMDGRPTVGIVYCEAELFGETNGLWAIPDFSLPHLLIDNSIFSAAFFRREDWRTIGGYRERMRDGWEDWDFWLTLAESRRDVVRIPDRLFFYRVRRDSRDRSLNFVCKLKLLFRLVANHWQLYLRYLPEIIQIMIVGARRRPAPIKI